MPQQDAYAGGWAVMRAMIRWYAVFALCLVCVAPVVAAPVSVRPTPESSSWNAVGSVDQPTQQTEASDDTPALMGMEAQLIFFAFLVVVLVVPWIMARAPSDPRPPAAVDRSAINRDGAVFTSDRERRLWLWTLVVLVAIYSTLSPAQKLAAALREQNLLGVTTTAALLLVGVVLAVQWAKTQPGRRETGAALGVMAVYLTTLIRMPVPEARSHLFEYGLVAVLIFHALKERRGNGRRVPVPAVMAVVVTALLGWLDEAIQMFLPNRVYDLVDVGLNAAFATMAIAAALVLGWARQLDIIKRLRRSSPITERSEEAS